MAERGGSVLIRQVRLVPVGRRTPWQQPVDVRIAAGVVTEVGPGLTRRPGEGEHDADGRWAIPGLWDQHVHMAQWARTLGRLDLSGAESAAHASRLVGTHAAARDDDTVIVGFGHRSATWPVAPTVADLDAVSGRHPVVLISGDGHHGWLNSAALAALGLPPRVGVLAETDWFPVFGRLETLPGFADDESAYPAAVARAAAVGIVGIGDMEFGAGYHDWPERVARGLDRIRVRPATYVDRLPEVLAAGLRTGDRLDDLGLITMGPLKVISDGSLNTRTAHCHQPYAGDPPSEHPRGRLNQTPEELTDLVRRAHTHGLEVAVHAIGDAAVGIALDAIAAVGARGSIEHAQLMDVADVARLARLGLRASVQPAHLFDDRDVTDVCWPDRGDRCFMLHSLVQAGATLALGSDAPVAPLDPWLAMAAAVHRSADQREPWNPAEALTPEQALYASTDGQTTLAIGSRGDVVLLDRDPLARPGGDADTAATARALRTMPVAATFLAGRLTHSPDGQATP
jgi:predicted amidohydrolase YtcJ